MFDERRCESFSETVSAIVPFKVFGPDGNVELEGAGDLLSNYQIASEKTPPSIDLGRKVKKLQGNGVFPVRAAAVVLLSLALLASSTIPGISLAESPNPTPTLKPYSGYCIQVITPAHLDANPNYHFNFPDPCSMPAGWTKDQPYTPVPSILERLRIARAAESTIQSGDPANITRCTFSDGTGVFQNLSPVIHTVNEGGTNVTYFDAEVDGWVNGQTVTFTNGNPSVPPDWRLTIPREIIPNANNNRNMDIGIYNQTFCRPDGLFYEQIDTADQFNNIKAYLFGARRYKNINDTSLQSVVGSNFPAGGNFTLSASENYINIPGNYIISTIENAPNSVDNGQYKDPLTSAGRLTEPATKFTVQQTVSHSYLPFITTSTDTRSSSAGYIKISS